MSESRFLCLEIVFPDRQFNQDVQNVLEFDADITVKNASAVVRNTLLKNPTTENRNDHALYLPSAGIWLEEDRTLGSYSLHTGNKLEYSRKTRPLLVKLMDGSVHEIEVSETQIVLQVLTRICNRFDIQNQYECSLTLEGTDNAIDYTGSLHDGKSAFVHEQKRLYQLNKNERTGDDLVWLNHDKTLKEQGVYQGSVVTLRRKYFYSKSDVSSTDPIKLFSLFTQARDAILNGTHPVNAETAYLLAAYVCQSSFSDFSEEKQAHGFLEKNSATLLHADYTKTKSAEKKIFSAWRTLEGLSRLDSQCLYVQTCQSMPTYGVTFVLVQELMDDKQKLIPRLLGVSKDAVLVIDDTTKNLLKTWPLTMIRRWFSTSEGFTLDLGSNADTVYSANTSYGKHISDMISGYMSIIHKDKQCKLLGSFANEQWPSVLKLAIEELESDSGLLSLGTDASSLKCDEDQLTTNRHVVRANLSLMNSRLACIVTNPGSGARKMETYVRCMASGASRLIKGVDVIRSLSSSENMKNAIKGTAKRVLTSFALVINLMQHARKDQHSDLLLAFSRLTEAEAEFLVNIGDAECNSDYHKGTARLVDAIQNAVDELSAKANAVQECIREKTQREAIAVSSTSCATGSRQLSQCANFLSYTVDDSQCLEQLNLAIKQIAGHVDDVIAKGKISILNLDRLNDIGIAATSVNGSLNKLVQYIQNRDEKFKPSVAEESCNAILHSYNRMMRVKGNSKELLWQSKCLAKSSFTFVKHLREQFDAKSDDIEKQGIQVIIVKKLAERVRGLVSVIKSESMSSISGEQQLYKTATSLRMALVSAAACTMRQQMVVILHTSATKLATTLQQTISVVQHCAEFSHMINFAIDGNSAVLQLPQIIFALQSSSRKIDSSSTQLKLVSACSNLIPACHSLIDSCMHGIQTIQGTSITDMMSHCASWLSEAVVEVEQCLEHSKDMFKSLEIDFALGLVNLLREELCSLHNKVPRPLSVEIGPSATPSISKSVKLLSDCVGRLFDAISQTNIRSSALVAMETADSLKQLVVAMYGAVSTDKTDARIDMIQGAESVVNKVAELLTMTKTSIDDPSCPISENRLRSLSKTIYQALESCLSKLPGQREITNIMEKLLKTSQVLYSSGLPATNRQFFEVQSDLQTSALRLSAAVSKLLKASGAHSDNLTESAQQLGTAVSRLINVGVELIVLTKDGGPGVPMKKDLKNISLISDKLLLATRNVLISDNAETDAKRQLQSNSKAMTIIINRILSTCVTDNSDQRQCDNSLRVIEVNTLLLERPLISTSEVTYVCCLDLIRKTSNAVCDSADLIVACSNERRQHELAKNVEQYTLSLSKLIEAVCQATYNMAILDPTSEPGRLGLADAGQLDGPVGSIKESCAALASLCQSGLAHAADLIQLILEQTSTVCQICRIASSRTGNIHVKQLLVGHAKRIVTSVAIFAMSAKRLERVVDNNEVNICICASKQFLNAVEQLDQFLSRPEYLTMPPKLSAEAKLSQLFVTSKATDLCTISTKMIETVKGIGNIPNVQTLQDLADQRRSIHDYVDQLVKSMRIKSPWKNECVESVKKIKISIIDIDQATLSAISQQIGQSYGTATSLEKNEALKNEVLNSCLQLHDSVNSVVTASETDTERLGIAIASMALLFGPLVKSVIDTASKTADQQRRMNLLDQSKKTLLSSIQFIVAIQDGVNDSKSVLDRDAISDTGHSIKHSLSDLLEVIAKSMTGSNERHKLVESINDCISKFNLKKHDRNGCRKIASHQESLAVSSIKDMMPIIQEMSRNININPAKLYTLLERLTEYFKSFCEHLECVIVSSDSQQRTDSLTTAISSLGPLLTRLVVNGMLIGENPSNSTSKHKLMDNSLRAAESVSSILADIQSVIIPCLNEENTISSLIVDLDASIMFASTASFNAETYITNQNKSQEDLSISSLAKDILKESELLITAVSQHQFVKSAASVVEIMSVLVDVTKCHASRSNTIQAQLSLLNGVKHVALLLRETINAAKVAFAKPDHDTSRHDLSNVAERMASTVDSFLKTVEKSVETNASCGNGDFDSCLKTAESSETRRSRIINSTIDVLLQDIKLIDHPVPLDRQSTAEELLVAAKNTATDTSKTFDAVNCSKQEDYLASVNLSSSALVQLMKIARGVIIGMDNDVSKIENREKVQKCAQEFISYLQFVADTNTHERHSDACDKHDEYSKRLSVYTADLINFIQTELMANPEQKQETAGDKLVNAANSIEVATKQLRDLRSNNSRFKSVDNEEALSEDKIMDAADSIANAITTLIKSAVHSQDETTNSDDINTEAESMIYHNDELWSDSVISAADTVVEATRALHGAFKEHINGRGSKEKLVISAKQVSASTSQLMMACKEKTKVECKSMESLQTSGDAVRKAVDCFVDSAQLLMYTHPSRSPASFSGIHERTQEAKQQISKLETELRKATNTFEYMIRLDDMDESVSVPLKVVKNVPAIPRLFKEVEINLFLTGVNRSVKSMREKQEMKEDIWRLNKQVDEARRRLAALNRDSYKMRSRTIT